MERRAFLTGLLGVAGVAAMASMTGGTAQAAPLARSMGMPETPEPDVARTPDGTEVTQAQARRRYYRRGPPPRARRYHRRRRSRLVCRNTRWRGRWVRRCRRVFY